MNRRGFFGALAGGIASALGARLSHRRLTPAMARGAGLSLDAMPGAIDGRLWRIPRGMSSLAIEVTAPGGAGGGSALAVGHGTCQPMGHLVRSLLGHPEGHPPVSRVPKADDPMLANRRPVRVPCGPDDDFDSLVRVEPLMDLRQQVEPGQAEFPQRVGEVVGVHVDLGGSGPGLLDPDFDGETVSPQLTSDPYARHRDLRIASLDCRSDAARLNDGWPGHTAVIAGTAGLPPLLRFERLVALFGESGDDAPAFAAALIGELVLTQLRLDDLRAAHFLRPASP